MRVLFVGESWLGSCARSLKEALARHPDVCLDEVNEDLHVPKPRHKTLRAINRVLRHSYQQELYREIRYRLDEFSPSVVVVYKGGRLEESFVRQIQARGTPVVNVYPDLSPHAHGEEHRLAIGAYDLIISTKPFHPALWRSVYGYANPCLFVPQGYDPSFHLVPTPPTDPQFDVVLIATWRHEYGQLMERLAALLPASCKVAVGGHGWAEWRERLPGHWLFPGGLQGRAYVEWLRRGRICLGLLTRKMVVAGSLQPGDEDTTRTYELAAAHCFFIHRRTEFVQTLYAESDEVPMFDAAEDLAAKITYFLTNPTERLRLAANAHRRAVPEYGLDARAREIVRALSTVLDQRQLATSRL